MSSIHLKTTGRKLALHDGNETVVVFRILRVNLHVELRRTTCIFFNMFYFESFGGHLAFVRMNLLYIGLFYLNLS